MKCANGVSKTDHHSWIKVSMDDDLAGTCHLGDIVQIFGDVRVSVASNMPTLKPRSHFVSEEEVLNKYMILLGV